MITMKIKASLIALGLVGTLAIAQASGDQPSLRVRLDRAVDRAIREHRIVGTVVIVAIDGKVVYHRAAGLADRERKKPMKEDTIFRLASMSKSIVSMAALRLADQGVLHLDDPVTRWIPSFKPTAPDGAPATITIRQLLNHTAGLTYSFLEPANGPYHRAHVSDGLDQPGLSMEENLRRISSVPLAYKPGTGWGYSVADDVLGEIIARATGKPLPVVVKSLVTIPLKMSSTSFSVIDRSRLAAAYADGAKHPVLMTDSQVIPVAGFAGVRYSPTRAFNARSFPSGGAGMVGTSPDYLRLLEEIRTGKHKVLHSQTLASMRSVQTGNLPISVAGPGWGFGYGFSVLKDPALAKTPQSKGTAQWGGAYGGSWFIDPVRRISVVALTNTTFEGMSGKFPKWVRDAVYGVDSKEQP